MAGTLVAEALAKGDMGLAVADPRAGLGGHRDRAVGERRAAADLPPGVRRATDVPAAALALTEPQVLFDVLSPRTTAVRKGDGYVLNGVKSLVPRGADAELFVVGAELDGQAGAVPRRVVDRGPGASRATRRWACGPPR